MNKYNVLLTYKDGSTFECAIGVTLERANQIKTEVERRKARNAFMARDVDVITITSGTGGNDE